MRRQQEFLQLLKLRTNQRNSSRKLQAWLLDWERGRTPEYEQLSNEVYEKRIQFYIAVDKLLTPAPAPACAAPPAGLRRRLQGAVRKTAARGANAWTGRQRLCGTCCSLRT